ncbi:DUF2752 domain-containing protein [Streptomyces sp. DSM 44917]|uniref:DUF2752 domain-containing protein n=1 Tax=Streptomyces boetiae TaxID=3075541 RepID=A0ABU2L502_9ACTN|nr:DUF2752 domain-containing protein [Streptomyces sp. DSM 44917]MDT0306647.1 DUF2752 domain-containing protein [Streptomyces sp. DSM 44917]
MRPTPSALAAPLAAAAVTAAALAFVAAADPGRPGVFPACPVLAWWGLYCPGCGGLRSAHALAHGDPAAALGANALAVAAFAAWAVVLAGWLLRAARGRSPLRAHPAPRARAPGSRALRAPAPALLGTAAFTILRNLEAGAALTP